MAGDITGSAPLLGFRSLPHELKLKICLDALKYYVLNEHIAFSSYYIYETCFWKRLDFSHTGLDGRKFEVTIRNLIREYFAEEHNIFSREYLFSCLFPHGSVGDFGNGRLHANHYELYRVIAYEGRSREDFPPKAPTQEEWEDYYYIRCLCDIHDYHQFWISAQQFRWDDNALLSGAYQRQTCDILPLWRFLGEYPSDVPDLDTVQARYDYLSTLTIEKRKTLDRSLDNVVNLIVRQHRNNPPRTDCVWYKAYHGTSTHAEHGHRPGGVPVDLPRQEFVCSGAYAICLKHLLLSLSWYSWSDLYWQEDHRPWIHDWEVRHPPGMPFREPWQEELTRDGANRSMLIPTTPSSFFGDSLGTIRLLPSEDIRAASSMYRFVQLCPLWAWQQAIELPKGQPLDIRGSRPAGVWTGFYYVDRSTYLHPEWDPSFWNGDDTGLADLFGDVDL